jgi:hypothetical protein
LSNRRDFKLLRGGADRERVVGGVRLVTSPPGRPPFPVDAVVVEEDTYLVLSAETDLRIPAEHPLRVMTAAHESEPEPLGSVVVRSGEPPTLLAVVHDLSREPSCEEEWVVAALEETFRQADRLRLTSIALPLLGAVQGVLEPDHCAELLWAVLVAVEPQTLERIWLVTVE